jgi:(E)-4-hydroxy-3-methylbut-2-enyl-diphosphate synthase
METNTHNLQYCNSLINYSRLETSEVGVGTIKIGGKNPIRVQSMTNTDTMDTEATVNQCIEIIEAGGELVRITAPRPVDAENLQKIKDTLRAKGYANPLVADIHFNPKAAEIAAGIVEKVRINPGNYIDKKIVGKIEYTQEEYNQELIKIRERLLPLIKICKEKQTAIRIGTNHGSLSDRIVSRYGDTPEGMVEATLEFLRIFVAEKFTNIIISLKASNTRVMVQATRLLAAKMRQENMNFPLHLGVTEAGDSEDGRIKSAVGIGTLLADGLGDTIRVSLTESPAKEIPVAKKIIAHFKDRDKLPKLTEINFSFNPYQYKKRNTRQVNNIGKNELPAVIADLSGEIINHRSVENIGFKYDKSSQKWTKTESAPEYIYTGLQTIKMESTNGLPIVLDSDVWSFKSGHYPVFEIEDFLQTTIKSPSINFVRVNYKNTTQKDLAQLKYARNMVIIAETETTNGLAEQRALFLKLQELEIDAPVIIHRKYKETEVENFQIKSACDAGALFIDGFGDGIWLSNDSLDITQQQLVATSFNILQASRVRQTKTEYISCPSCGRTLFDLQEVTASIKSKTSHLKGLKIGIMGCIVNGPGEMADADYGYVGTGLGKITLYKQREIVKRSIPSTEAVDELIKLIKQNGDWQEPDE